MARRTRAQIREEFVRLLPVWTFVREAEIRQKLEEAVSGGTEWSEAELADLLPTSEELLAQFDAGDNHRSVEKHGGEIVKIPASEQLAGLKEGLADISADIAIAIKDGEDAGEWGHVTWPDRYRSLTGRDLMADLGSTEREVKAMLRRGRVRSEEEWRMLRGHAEGGLLSDAQQIKAFRMLDEYEHALMDEDPESRP